MASGVRNVIIAQVFLAAVVALAYLLWQSRWHGAAAAYGGGIALLNSFLLARRVRRAGELEGSSVALAMYAGAVQRFVITLVGFAVGIALLRLSPLPLIVAFAVAQLGFVIAAGRQQP
ncbi:MAG: ATP synthase subunit I [Gammaproteobacteria bacterium]|nr:ATP synthase subunit I [Gammaproteobacteria bacterium]NIR98834.1 ATP synthase subunit I [Gammaproteobacteria bacterium]